MPTRRECLRQPRIAPPRTCAATVAVAVVTAAVGSACAPNAPSSPGDTTGTVAVRATTTGQHIPTGYDVTIDDAGVGTVSANGEAEFDGVAPGARSVGLAGLPVNCGVDGPNPRQATVSEAATTEVAFGIVCGALPTGIVEVETTTSGEDLDPDGYTVAIDQETLGPIGIQATRTFPGIPVGDREVALLNLASNCSVQGTNPRTVPVSEGQTAPTTFAVVCAVTTGTIDVLVSTSGFNEDDSYTVSLDDSATLTVSRDGDVTFDEVAPGQHEVRLGDVAGNCDVETENPVRVTVSAGETADVEFEVSCGFF